MTKEKVTGWKGSVVLPVELHERAERYCAKGKVSFCGLVRQALREYLDRREAGSGPPGGVGAEAASDFWKEALQRAGGLFGLDGEAMGRLIIAEQLAAYLERGRQMRANTESCASGQRAPAEKNAAGHELQTEAGKEETRC